MARVERKKAGAGDPVRKPATKRRERQAARQSVNLSISPEHRMRFYAMALMMDTTPSELLMDWIEEKSVGLRLSMPGYRPLDGGSGREDEGKAVGEDVPEDEGVTPSIRIPEPLPPGGGEGSGAGGGASPPPARRPVAHTAGR